MIEREKILLAVVQGLAIKGGWFTADVENEDPHLPGPKAFAAHALEITDALVRRLQDVGS